MALPNGDLITTVFDPQMAYPVDKRMQVDTLNSRDSMSMFIRWEGMEVYVLENSKKYILQGGRSNEYWKENGTGTGTGGTTFVGQFESADLLPTSGRSAGDYAFVGTGDDFVQYNWDNIANQWVMAEGQTDMASEFFHIGHKTPLRRPVIFPLLPKDVLVQESGDFVFAPETAVARFIFTGEVTAIRGIETAAADREIKLVNRTGSDIPLRDKASGISIDSGFDFGGTDYTWVNGSEITLKGNGTYWELAPNNQVAFSDHLDSVNAEVSVGSDGLEVITGVYDRYTGNQAQFKEISGSHTADGIVIVFLNGKYFRRTDKEYYIESFGPLIDGSFSSTLQTALDLVSKTQSRKLIIDGYDLALTTQVTNSTDDLTIEFRNGGQISQPTPATNITWEDHNLRLTMSGSNLTLINFRTDGKFDNEGLNDVPSPVKHFCVFTGSNVRFLGKTILENSGGYNLDVRGDRCYIDDVFGKNNAYSSLRFNASGSRQFFRIGKAEFIQNVGPIARKSGLTVNGQNQVQLIEIGSYIGLNAPPFTEATVGGTGDYYQNVVIGYLRNDFNVDTEYKDGSPASSFSGKLENAVNITIGRIDNNNNSPLNKGQGMWFTQAKKIKIGEIHTNAGDWSLGNNAQIGIFDYNETGNTGDVLMRCQSGGKIIIDELITNIPSTTSYKIWNVTTDSKYVLNKYTPKGNHIGLARATYTGIRNQIDVPEYIADFISLSQFSVDYRQSISTGVKITRVVNLQSITRDVEMGEWFLLNTSPYVRAILIKDAGTMSWSGTTFTGTAKFEKFIARQNYSGTALTNITSLLTDDDIGITTNVNSVPSVWGGTSAGWLPILSSIPEKPDSVVASTNNTLTATAKNFYRRYTGSTGTTTINADVHSAGDEHWGEIEGGDRTFVAGSGVTLRYPTGQGLVAPTGSKYIIKFKSPNDALVTIIKPYTSPNASTAQRGIIEQATDDEIKTGTDTERAVDPKGLKDNYLSYSDRTITSSGTIAITPLTYNVRQETIIFTGTAPITLNGFNDAVSNRNLILVNQTGGTITIPASSGVTVPFAAATTIGDGEVSRFMVYNNLILKEV